MLQQMVERPRMDLFSVVFLPCSVSLEVFTTFFTFDLALSRNSSDGSGEGKEEGVMIRECFHDGSCGASLTSDLVPLSSALGLAASRSDPTTSEGDSMAHVPSCQHHLLTHSPCPYTVQGLNRKVQSGASMVGSCWNVLRTFQTWMCAERSSCMIERKTG